MHRNLELVVMFGIMRDKMSNCISYIVGLAV